MTSYVGICLSPLEYGYSHPASMAGYTDSTQNVRKGPTVFRHCQQMGLAERKGPVQFSRTFMETVLYLKKKSSLLRC